jgi:hypothetical protein
MTSALTSNYGPLKYGVGSLLAVVIFLSTAWIYRSFLRPIDPLTSDTLALASHFESNGIPVRPYAVRHTFPHSEMVAAAALEIKGFPLPVNIDVCPNAVAAASRLQAVSVSRNLMHPMRNGRLVMYLPMWGAGTDEMAKRVERAFASFPGAS